MLITTLAVSLALAGGSCTEDERAAGLCPRTTNTGTSVDASASYTQPGSGPAPEQRDHPIGGGGGEYLPVEDEYGIADPRYDETVRAICDAEEGCPDLVLPETEPEPEESEEGLPPLTISDLVSFAPPAAPVAAEPGNVGIVGMPVNFVVPADTHEQSGTVLDFAVTVRFTPAAILFDYGDGTTRETTDGGATWESLAAPQFTATTTSHAYGATGVYTATASVIYTAHVNFGGTWHPVPGTLDIPGQPASIEIFELRTALVAETCLENPTGPGC